MANVIYSALEPLGFESEGAVCFGTWKGYAVSLRQFSGKTYYADVAVRLPKIPGGLRKNLNRELKEPGLKIGGIELIRKSVITMSISFSKVEEAAARFTEKLDKLTAALREQGIAPADTCAVSGASRPDSLCLVVSDGILSYQPVCAAVIREKGTHAREKAEENQANGSYVLGFVGALLGMLVGLIPNVLGIIYTERIYGLLFALVPLASMFGYKLFTGKMSKGSIVIVIVLSLLGVVLIPWMELSFYLVRDYGTTVREGLSYAAQYLLAPGSLAEIGGELLQLLLFMALGIWIAWKYMSGQTNSSQVMSSEAQLATLRPNPAYAATEEVGSAY